jgi:hypothetical protein
MKSGISTAFMTFHKECHAGRIKKYRIISEAILSHQLKAFEARLKLSIAR